MVGVDVVADVAIKDTSGSGYIVTKTRYSSM